MVGDSGGGGPWAVGVVVLVKALAFFWGTVFSFSSPRAVPLGSSAAAGLGHPCQRGPADSAVHTRGGRGRCSARGATCRLVWALPRGCCGAVWRLPWLSLAPSAAPGASWLCRCCPLPGPQGPGSTWRRLLASRFRCSKKSAVQQLTPLLLRSPQVAIFLAGAGRALGSGRPPCSGRRRLSVPAARGGEGATSRHWAPAASPAAGGAGKKDARKRKAPAGPRVARGCAPWFLAREQLLGPPLAKLLPEKL
ncbi:uncharacterized protein LOC124903761 [Homo sapiens]|uniref:uncharacterized protein LOC124903761 n=1 Tax=Homo sapiens TaxID=9606 RepID=UPI001FB1807C|nr:uncharacterized protein LOC124903761 [Homo sapiens]